MNARGGITWRNYGAVRNMGKEKGNIVFRHLTIITVFAKISCLFHNWHNSHRTIASSWHRILHICHFSQNWDCLFVHGWRDHSPYSRPETNKTTVNSWVTTSNYKDKDEDKDKQTNTKTCVNSEDTWVTTGDYKDKDKDTRHKTKTQTKANTCVNSEDTWVTTGWPPLNRRLLNVSPVLNTLKVKVNFKFNLNFINLSSIQSSLQVTSHQHPDDRNWTLTLI